jgi:uncharacterized RDD family membrane protein YckC
MNSKSLKVVGVACGAFVMLAAAVPAARTISDVSRTAAHMRRHVSSSIRWALIGDRGTRVRFVEVAQAAPVPPQAPRSAPARPEVPAPPAVTIDQSEFRTISRRVRPIVRIGQDYVVRAGETVDDVVIVSGSLRIDGHVEGDVAVIVGTVDLGSGAVVDGNVVNVGGGVTAQPGATINGDLVTVGGGLTAPVAFLPRGEQVVVGSAEIGRHVRAFVPWVTRGLLLGRPIVPGLGWVWVFLAIAFFVSLVLSLIFEPAVRTCATAIAAKPLTTFLTGLLVLLLVGPIVFILAVSVVGIVVIPFVACALLIAFILGKIAVTRWLGWCVVREDETDSRLQVVRSFVIGFVIISLAYMVPVLGLLTWALTGVLGLGAATATLFRTLRRENPAPPAPPVKVQPLPPSPMPAAGGPVPDLPLGFVAPDGPPAGAPEVPPAAPSWASSGSGSASASASTSAPPVDAGDVRMLALPRASLSQRLAAGGLDALLVLFVFQLMDPHSREMFWFLTLLTAYNAAFWTWRGTTIGGIICQLRVVRTDGRPLVFGDSVVRGLSSLFSLMVLGIGFFWIRLAGNHDRQAWHDLIAGTVVVRVPKSMPLR